MRQCGSCHGTGSADLRLTLLLSEFLKEGEADRKHQYGGNDAPHGLFAFFPVFGGVGALPGAPAGVGVSTALCAGVVCATGSIVCSMLLFFLSRICCV